MAIQTLKTWTESVSGGYKTYTSEECADNSSTADSIASANINDDLNGKKVMVGVNFTAAYDNVAIPISVEASTDGGTTWGIVGTATADMDHTTGLRLWSVDLSDVKGMGPFRIHANGGTGATAVNMNTTGNLKFTYSVEEEGVGFGGTIGKDPS